jgi:hypothetical protein
MCEQIHSIKFHLQNVLIQFIKLKTHINFEIWFDNVYGKKFKNVMIKSRGCLGQV